jgi:hypothetical protein
MADREPLQRVGVFVILVVDVLMAFAIGADQLDGNTEPPWPGTFSRKRAILFRNLEATPRIELGMEVLQTSALPLGYVA